MSFSIEAPSTPLHVLRTHKDPVNTLFCSRDNERIYSGDAKGRIVIWSTRSLRPIADWLAHTDAILGAEELGENQIITHGRDNKIHVWERPEQSVAIRPVGAATLTESSAPTLCYSMDVNALNYCRFSLLPISSSDETSALLAVPNLVESSQLRQMYGHCPAGRDFTLPLEILSTPRPSFQTVELVIRQV